MFENLKERIRLMKADKWQKAFDQRHNDSGLYGKWENGRRVYSNGCYSVPVSVDRYGDPIMKLYSRNGKELDEAEIMKICDWHHGFVKVELPYGIDEAMFDCDGACVRCYGIFISDEETGENLYLLPCQGDKYQLYNSKEHFIAESKKGYSYFSGFKSSTDGNGNKAILGVISDQSESRGWGTLNEEKKYDYFVLFDLDGRVLNEWKEWK